MIKSLNDDCKQNLNSKYLCQNISYFAYNLSINLPIPMLGHNLLASDFFLLYLLKWSWCTILYKLEAYNIVAYNVKGYILFIFII